MMADDASGEQKGTLQKKIILMHLINGYLLAGAEKLVFDLVGGIDKSRYEVLVCSIGVIRDSLENEVCNNLKTKGIKTLVLGKPAGRRRIETIRKLRRILLDNHVAILHTHCPSPDFYGKISAFLAGTPLVFSTIHSISGYHAKHESFLKTLTTRYIAISDTVNRYAVRDLKIPSAKIETIRNAVDTGRLSQMPVDRTLKLRELGVPEGKKIVTTVGILREVKGHRYLVDAAEQVIRKFPDTHFLIVGDASADTELTRQLREMMKAKNLQNSISLAGKRGDIPEILAISDIFVLPSLWEGLSIALLEAMAAGVPAIATNVGSNPEVITDGVDGFIVPPKDSGLIARRINELLADQQRADNLGLSGKKKIKDSFCVDQLIKRHEELYLAHLNRTKNHKSQGRHCI